MKGGSRIPSRIIVKTRRRRWLPFRKSINLKPKYPEKTKLNRVRDRYKEKNPFRTLQHLDEELFFEHWGKLAIFDKERKTLGISYKGTIELYLSHILEAVGERIDETVLDEADLFVWIHEVIYLHEIIHCLVYYFGDYEENQERKELNEKIAYKIAHAISFEFFNL